jgi:hypothetical protein
MKVPYYIVSEALSCLQDQEAAGFNEYEESLADVLASASSNTNSSDYDLVSSLRALERVLGKAQWFVDTGDSWEQSPPLSLFVPRPRNVLISLLKYAKRQLR